MPFINDQELRNQLYQDIRKCAGIISSPYGEDPEAFARYNTFMSGSCLCYEKLLRFGIEDAYRYDIHFQDDPEHGPMFDSKFSEHNNLYHIITRAMMYDEVFCTASTLPNMPKDFITDLRTFAERLDVELPIIMITRMPDGNADEALATITQPFVMSTMSNALRITQRIMVNAMTSLSSENVDIQDRSMKTMEHCCRYLERIGITPTVVEGSSEDGDMWYDLHKKRMRDVGANLTWYDYFVKRDITCSCPFHLPGKR